MRKSTVRSEAAIGKSSIARDSGDLTPRARLRRALLASREALSDERREAGAMAIGSRLVDLVALLRPAILGLYWPVRGEPDLVAWLAALTTGTVLALPVVDGPAQPLRFVAWRPGDPMVPGAYRIPRPAAGPTVVPDALVVPCVGFDARCHRIGYGGGFYDRTLAAASASRVGGLRPVAIGVAFDELEVADVTPEMHDVALDAVVTPTRVMMPEGASFGALAARAKGQPV